MSAPSSSSVPAPQVPVDPDHALLCGQVAMTLRMELLRPGPMTTDDVSIVDDEDGNHTDAVRIARPSGTYLVLIKKET